MSAPHRVWEDACEQARRMVLDEANFERQGDAGLEAAEHLGIIARLLKGIACKRCGGAGRAAYGSSSGSSGGAGGMTMTADVCDLCWGTGRSDSKGVNVKWMRESERKLSDWRKAGQDICDAFDSSKPPATPSLVRSIVMAAKADAEQTKARLTECEASKAPSSQPPLAGCDCGVCAIARRANA